MNEVSLRQKALAAVVFMVALYAVAVATWFLNAEAAWKRSQRNYLRAQKAYESECRLIAERQQWIDAYDKEKSQMPLFDGSKATDTTWLEKMDTLAVKHHIFISQRQAAVKEIAEGEVKELPIEVKQWEGSLESLVRFMHELENSSEGMFDISQLSMKPSSKQGYLRGNFTLNCAYMRE